MPLSISIRFLTGRAHLHHWHAHHSDGKVDWPPSPWRLLRALVAVAGTGLTSLPEPLDIAISDSADDALPVSRLAAVLAMLAQTPKIWLPRTGGGHTRQFLPKATKATGSAVFDTFATVSKKTPIVFEWPEVDAAASDERFTDLQTLLRRLTYFGRAESWCDAAAHIGRPAEVRPEATHWSCIALGIGVKSAGREHVDYTLERKLAPEFPLDTDLRKQSVEILPRCDFKVFESKTAKKTGMTTEKWAKPTPAQSETFKTTLSAEQAGISLLRCLLRSSGEDIKNGLERPIGSRWVQYTVPRAIYQLPASLPYRVARSQSDGPRITLMRFALNTATVNRPVLPSITDTLLVADKFRSASLAWHGELFRKPSDPRPRNLRGREDDDSIVQSGHDHACFWPSDEDGDGFIDHLSVFCRAGLQPDEVESLRRLLRLKQRGGRPDLLVTPVFEGTAEEFVPWQGTATNFVSATPYYPDGHITHGTDRGSRLKLGQLVRRNIARLFPLKSDEPPTVHQIVACGNVPASFVNACPPANHRAFPKAVLFPANKPLPPGGDFLMSELSGNSTVRPLDFCCRRKGVVINASGRYLQLTFQKPHPRVPFALGHSSHFGLGLFVPE